MTSDFEKNRPSPEEALSRIETNEKKAISGKLKIFFGSCAGVGKTYGMLTAAHEQLKEGQTVLVGVAETHGRPQTEALLEGLPVIKPLNISYRGVELEELDLDGALARRPNIILVDELAHTNAPGSRHPKRWHDVMELLEAGIHVYTTLNVQHIESLSDLVAGSTGIWVKETVPDSIFDQAEDVVLVDIDTDDLLRRLHEGNIYIAPEANKRAAENFFKKSNLNALREIALRRTAERVDAEEDGSQSRTDTVSIGEKLLVCVGAEAISAKLVRTTKRLSVALKAPWTALHIEGTYFSKEKQDSISRSMTLLERMVVRLGGQMVTLQGEAIVDEIIAYARTHGFTKIIIGKDYRPGMRSIFKSLFVNKLIRKSGYIDVLVITEDTDEKKETPRTFFLTDLKPFNYILALLVVAVIGLSGHLLPNILTATDQALLYLTGIVLVAAQLGLGPSLFYALMAATSFSIFFLHINTLSIDGEHASLVTFAVMLITGYAIASQSSKLRVQAISARDKESRTRTLYELTRKLTSTTGRFPVTEIVCEELQKVHDVTGNVWMSNTDGHLSVIYGDQDDKNYYKDFGAIEWCLENSKNAGRGTSTMPNALGFYVPLITSNDTLGVIGLYPEDPDHNFSHNEITSIETIASLLTSALERVRADEVAQQASLEKENKKIHEGIMHTINQNIDLPLQTLAGTASNLMKDTAPLEAVEIQNFANAISLETNKLSKTLQNLVGTTHLETGGFNINRTPTALMECIDQALGQIAPQTRSHEITIDKNIPNDLPDLLIDKSMIQQLFVNLLENAIKYSPDKKHIQISAQRQGPEVMVMLDDEGAGLPTGFEEKIFDKFCSIPHAGHGKSAGLGLTLSDGIVRLHDGRMHAENRSGGGARFTFTLPLA